MTETAPTQPKTGDVVAKPDRSYRLKWLIMGGALLAWGWWSLYDGYVKYPRLNAEAVEDARRQGKPTPEKLPHGGYDIPLNKLIGWTLQPVAVLAIAWTLYRTRGEYRLSDGSTVLHVPGHPPVPLDNIREIDKSKWERKGVAHLLYNVPGAPDRTARLALDDYMYEREPTDEILKRIETALLPA